MTMARKAFAKAKTQADRETRAGKPVSAEAHLAAMVNVWIDGYPAERFRVTPDEIMETRDEVSLSELFNHDLEKAAWLLARFEDVVGASAHVDRKAAKRVSQAAKRRARPALDRDYRAKRKADRGRKHGEALGDALAHSVNTVTKELVDGIWRGKDVDETFKEFVHAALTSIAGVAVIAHPKHKPVLARTLRAKRHPALEFRDALIDCHVRRPRAEAGTSQGAKAE
jgi:hypothetical protein